MAEGMQSLVLVISGDFNLPDISWKDNTAKRKQSRRFLLVREPTGRSIPLDTVFTNREEVGDVVFRSCLQQSDHKMIEL